MYDHLVEIIITDACRVLTECWTQSTLDMLTNPFNNTREV